GEHHHLIGRAGAEYHLAGLEHASRVAYEDDIASACDHHGRARHRDHVSANDRVNENGGKHPRLEHEPGVWHRQADPVGAAHGVNRWIDEGHPTHQVFPGPGGDFDVHRHTLADQWQILLEDFPLDPDLREIGDAIEALTGHYPLPLSDLLFQDDPADRCDEGEGLGHLPARRECSNLGL